MDEETIIDSQAFVIDSFKDETIAALDFTENEKIFYLPILVDEVFPNVLVLAATSCSIKEVRRENLQNLRKLKHLWLRNNEIEELDSEAFQDLVSLRGVDFSNNEFTASFLPIVTFIYSQKTTKLNSSEETFLLDSGIWWALTS